MTKDNDFIDYKNPGFNDQEERIKFIVEVRIS